MSDRFRHPEHPNLIRRRCSMAMARHQFPERMIAELLAVVVVTMDEFTQEQKDIVSRCIKKDHVRVLMR